MIENNEETSDPEAVIGHLRESYANVQSVTRFMDTKASATIAASTTIISLLAAFVAWLLKVIESQNSDSWVFLVFPLFFCTVFCLIYSGYSLVTAIDCAFKCISPRDPGGSVSVLFPFIPVQDSVGTTLSNADTKLANDGSERIDKFTNSPICWSDIKEDYQIQLNRMGKIVYLKIKFCNEAIEALRLQFFWSLGAMTSGVLLFFVSKFQF
jgi:hypothetical protein